MPIRLQYLDARARAIMAEAAKIILGGVGDPMAEIVHEEPKAYALHHRRRATDEEAAAFVARKDAGDYAHRLVARGIV